MKIKNEEMDKDMILWLYYFILATVMLSGIVFCAVFVVFGHALFIPISIFLFAMFIYSIWQLVKVDMERQNKKKEEKEAYVRKEEVEKEA